MRTARLAEAYCRGRAGDHPKSLRTATGATAAYDLVNGLPCDVTPLIEAELRRWAEPTGNELPVGSEAEPRQGSRSRRVPCSRNHKNRRRPDRRGNHECHARDVAA